MHTHLLTCASKWQLRMAAMERGDLEGHLTANISSLFCESVLQRAGAPKVLGFLVTKVYILPS